MSKKESNLKTIIAEILKKKARLETSTNAEPCIYVSDVVTIYENFLKKLKNFEVKIQREVKFMDGDVKRGETNKWVPFWIRQEFLGMTEEEILG